MGKMLEIAGLNKVYGKRVVPTDAMAGTWLFGYPNPWTWPKFWLNLKGFP